MTFDRTTLAVMFAAGVFMFWAAGTYTVFDDEAFSTQRYVLPAGELLRSLWHGIEPDPPLYYLLQHHWVLYAGVKPVALRTLSIVFFLLSLPVIRAATAAWYDARTARWAVVLCGLHPLHLFFGFAARWYSMAFLCLACVLLAQARVPRRTNGRRWQWIWVGAAVACCYTNYFAAGLVLILWLLGVREREQRLSWLKMGAATALLYGPWGPAFGAELGRFPRFAPDLSSYGVTAGRTLMALFSGNLASPGAWYVWLGLVPCGACLLLLASHRPARLKTPGLLALAAILLGIATHTMIDKYVMVFSGPAWMAVAALLARPVEGWRRQVRSLAIAGLCFGWAGCGINWATEQRWSSLRWLDPFRQAVYDNLYAERLVATHPSVAYYYGIMDPQRWYGRLLPDRWRRRAAEVRKPAEALAELATRPASRPALSTGPATTQPAAYGLVLGASIAEAMTEWSGLVAALHERYDLLGEDQRLFDPDAAWKDRLDPRYRHPPYRVTVLRFGHAPAKATPPGSGAVKLPPG